MSVDRHPLAAGRDLVVSAAPGLVLLSIHAGGRSISGPLGVRDADVEAVRAALADLPGRELAADVERARAVLMASPGIAGYAKLRAALTGMSTARRHAAVTALRAAGEVVDRGDRGRPRLHIAPNAVYLPSTPPQTVGVHLDPYSESERAESGASAAQEGSL
jgi:hypothetical protein